MWYAVFSIHPCCPKFICPLRSSKSNTLCSNSLEMISPATFLQFALFIYVFMVSTFIYYFCSADLIWINYPASFYSCLFLNSNKLRSLSFITVSISRYRVSLTFLKWLISMDCKPALKFYIFWSMLPNSLWIYRERLFRHSDASILAD